jgi:hypothetical protein
MRANLHRSQGKVLEPLYGRWHVVARNLTFEDRRHARTSRIDFLAMRGRAAAGTLSRWSEAIVDAYLKKLPIELHDRTRCSGAEVTSQGRGAPMDAPPM